MMLINAHHAHDHHDAHLYDAHLLPVLPRPRGDSSRGGVGRTREEISEIIYEIMNRMIRMLINSLIMNL